MRSILTAGRALLLRLGPIVCVCVLASSSRVASLELSLPAVQAKAGQVVQVPVSISGANDLGACQLEVRFDPAVVEGGEVGQGALLSNALIDSKVAGDTVRVAFASSDPINGSGELVRLTLRVRGRPGQETRLTLQNAKAWTNSTRQALPINATGGKLVVGGGGIPTWVWLAVAGALVALFLLVVLVVAAVFIFRRSRAAPADVTYRCPQCGGTVIGGMRHCPTCGTRVAV